MSLLRANRRPIVLAAIALALLAIHHVLLRTMAHDHTAYVLLAAGHRAPGSAAALAIALVVTRFLTVMVAPGLLLAAGAEVVAYVLVGPKQVTSDDDAAFTVTDDR